MKPINTFALTPLVAAMALANAQYSNADPSECPDPFVVNTLVPADGLAFIEALNLVGTCSNPVVIEISDSLAGETISLGGFYLDNQQLEIKGPSTADTTITFTDPESNSFKVAESGQLKLSNLILDGNSDGETNIRSVAAINVETGKLELDKVMVQNFHSADDGVIISNGEVSITDTVFKNNHSDDPGSSVAALSNSSLIIKNSTFEGNQTGDTANGGTVYGAQNSEITIENSTFKNNSAAGRAGAVQADGDLNLTGSTFKDNKAEFVAGAVYIDTSNNTSDSNIVITDTVFDGNSAIDSEVGSGGAIYITSPEANKVDVSINRSLFVGNSAGYRAGTLHLLDSSSNNVKLVISNSTITNNTAIQNAGITLSGGYATGSKISHSTIVNNTSSASNGGSAIYGNGLTSGANFEISHTIISNNTGGYAQVCNYNEANYDFAYDNSFVSNDDASSSSCLSNTKDNASQIGSTEATLDPMLEDLADNGGATQSFYPKFGSPVIDAGDKNIANAPAADQRGNDRIMRGAIDIGAVEYGNLAPTLTNTNFEDPGLTEGDEINYDASVLFSDPEGDSLSFSATGLPNGTSISATGEITGTVNDSGTFNVVVRAQDNYGAYTETTLKVDIKANPDSSGGGALAGNSIWLGLLMLLGLRRKTHSTH